MALSDWSCFRKTQNNFRRPPSRNYHPSCSCRCCTPDCNCAECCADGTQDRNCKFPRNTAVLWAPADSRVVWAKFRFVPHSDSDSVKIEGCAAGFPAGPAVKTTCPHLKQSTRGTAILEVQTKTESRRQPKQTVDKKAGSYLDL